MTAFERTKGVYAHSGVKQLTNSKRDTAERQRQYRESTEQAERALATNLSEMDKKQIMEIKTKRETALADAQIEHDSLDKQRKDLEIEIQNTEALFAQTEFLNVCQNERYRRTPLSVANALAGLPFIGWRQSTKRCLKRKPQNTAFHGYDTFKAIRNIVRSWKRSTDLASYAEQRLRLKRTESRVNRELRECWYYLKVSIEAAPTEERDADVLSAFIASEYSRRMRLPTAAEVLLAQEYRIRQ